jgi:hypothetical protein
LITDLGFSMTPEPPPLKTDSTETNESDGLGGFIDFIADALQTPASNGPMNWETLSQQLQAVQRGLVDVIQEYRDGRSCLAQISSVLDQAAQTVFLVWHDVTLAELADAPAQIANKAKITPRIAAAVQQLATECLSQRRIQASAISLSRTAVQETAKQNRLHQETGEAPPPEVRGHVVSIPIVVDAEIVGVLTTCFFSDTFPGHWLTAIAETAASAIGLSLASQRNSELERELAATSAIVDLATRLESASSFEGAGRVLCEELARHIGCPQVVTGFTKNKRCRILARSGSNDPLDPSRSRLFDAALDEVIIRETTIVWPASERTDRHSLLTLKQLAESEGQNCVVGVPIRNHSSDLIGAWLFLGGLDLRDEENHQNFIRACEHRLGTALMLVKNAQRSRWTKLLRSIGSRSSR